MEHLNIHENHEWHGVFELPKNNKSIHGKIIYTPEKGIILEYLCDFSIETKKESYAHGKLHNGKVCTLIGNFDLNESGLTFGKTTIRHGKIKFDFLVYNEFITPDQKFIGFNSDFTSFQEFCHPQGFKDNLSYSNQAIKQYKCDSFEISILHSAKIKYPPPEISSLFVADNNEILKKLSEETQEIYEKYRKNLYTKKDMSWFIRFKNNPNQKISDYYRTLINLELFFAVLLHHPVRASTFQILQNSEHDPSKHKAINIIYSPFDLDKKKIDYLNKKINNHHLPINLEKINFESAIEKWFSHIDDFFVIAERLQNQNNTYYEYQTHADIVIYLTQIESIAKTEGKNKNNEKYIYPIEKYLRKECFNYLKHIIKNEDIGLSLSKLRGEIAHVKSNKQISKNLDGSDMIIISNILNLTILGYILDKLYIKKEFIEDYQFKNMLKKREE